MTPPAGTKEAFSRVVIDAQLQDVGWNLTDGQSVRYEYQLPDRTFADYVLSDRHGRAMAVVEAKRAAVNLQEAAAQGRAYAEQLDGVPYVFLANGVEILFWDYKNEAYTDAKGALRKSLIGKTIVFTIMKRHAETLAQMFDEAFEHEKPSPEVRYADFVVSGWGSDDTVDGPTKIKRFKKEMFPNILCRIKNR